jgi:hypothetical protein
VTGSGQHRSARRRSRHQHRERHEEEGRRALSWEGTLPCVVGAGACAVEEWSSHFCQSRSAWPLHCSSLELQILS